MSQMLLHVTLLGVILIAKADYRIGEMTSYPMCTSRWAMACLRSIQQIKRNKWMNFFTAILMAIAISTAPALADNAGLGIAGLLSGKNKETLEPIQLGAGIPLTTAPWTLTSGKYYEFEIQGDGSQELALIGPEFFRAIWIDEIVVEGLEIRPLGLDSIEFDEAGEMEIGFVAIKPGRYYLKIPGSTGETQRLEIEIK